MILMEEKERELESSVKELAEALGRTESSRHLDGLKQRLIGLVSAEEEIEHLERQHRLGYIKDDDYLQRHDQLVLRRNTLLAEIRDDNLLPIVEEVKHGESKSKLRKIVDAIPSYKDAIKAIAEIAGAALKGYLGS